MSGPWESGGIAAAIAAIAAFFRARERRLGEQVKAELEGQRILADRISALEMRDMARTQQLEACLYENAAMKARIAHMEREIQDLRERLSTAESAVASLKDVVREGVSQVQTYKRRYP